MSETQHSPDAAKLEKPAHFEEPAIQDEDEVVPADDDRPGHPWLPNRHSAALSRKAILNKRRWRDD